MISPKYMPLLAAFILLLGGGVFLLDKADKQTRDTTRKHHLQDIEDSLYFARSLTGTYPPYNEASWCGFLNAPQNSEVKSQVEEALRAQNDKYANLEKPFPTDPLANKGSGYDYFYWKRSPSTFELYSVLEAEKTGERNSLLCSNAPAQYFDYGIASFGRENKGGIVIDSVL